MSSERQKEIRRRRQRRMKRLKERMKAARLGSNKPRRPSGSAGS